MNFKLCSILPISKLTYGSRLNDFEVIYPHVSDEKYIDYFRGVSKLKIVDVVENIDDKFIREIEEIDIDIIFDKISSDADYKTNISDKLGTFNIKYLSSVNDSLTKLPENIYLHEIYDGDVLHYNDLLKLVDFIRSGSNIYLSTSLPYLLTKNELSLSDIINDKKDIKLKEIDFYNTDTWNLKLYEKNFWALKSISSSIDEDKNIVLNETKKKQKMEKNNMTTKGNDLYDEIMGALDDEKEFAPTFLFEEKGDIIVGELLSTQEDVGEYSSMVYTIKELKTGENYSVWGSTVLDDKLSEAEFGDIVGIKYLGKRKTYRVYNVVIRKKEK